MTDFKNVYDTYFKAVFLFIKGLSVWLFQIAKNTYYSYCKAQKRITNIEELSIVSDTFAFEKKLVDSEENFLLHRLEKFLKNQKVGQESPITEQK